MGFFTISDALKGSTEEAQLAQRVRVEWIRVHGTETGRFLFDPARPPGVASKIRLKSPDETTHVVSLVPEISGDIKAPEPSHGPPEHVASHISSMMAVTYEQKETRKCLVFLESFQERSHSPPGILIDHQFFWGMLCIAMTNLHWRQDSVSSAPS